MLVVSLFVRKWACKESENLFKKVVPAPSPYFLIHHKPNYIAKPMGTCLVVSNIPRLRSSNDLQVFHRIHALALVADREDSSIMPFNISALELNYLDNRNIWNGTIWSLLAPGVGHLYINRLPTGFFISIWFVIVCYFSKLLPAIQYTFLGGFQLATAILNPEWVLFLPSVIGFAAYDTYVQTVTLNKLFKIEQSRFLADNYQSKEFTLPSRAKYKGL